MLAPPGVQEEQQQHVKAEARRTRGRLPPTAGRRSQAGGHAANTPAIPNARGGVVPQDGHVQEDARGEQHPVIAPPPRGVEVDEGGGGGGRLRVMLMSEAKSGLQQQKTGPTDEGQRVSCAAPQSIPTYLPTAWHRTRKYRTWCLVRGKTALRDRLRSRQKKNGSPCKTKKSD